MTKSPPQYISFSLVIYFHLFISCIRPHTTHKPFLLAFLYLNISPTISPFLVNILQEYRAPSNLWSGVFPPTICQVMIVMWGSLALVRMNKKPSHIILSGLKFMNTTPDGRNVSFSYWQMTSLPNCGLFLLSIFYNTDNLLAN